MPIDRIAGLATVNLNLLTKVFIGHNDRDYKSVPDERFNKEEFPNAEVLQDVPIGEDGEILPKNYSQKKALALVDFNFIPGEADPLEIFPSEGKSKRNKLEKSIGEEGDFAINTLAALYKAKDLFNIGINESKSKAS